MRYLTTKLVSRSGQIPDSGKASNTKKEKGVSPVNIMTYVFSLVFRNRSMYMDMLLGNDAVPFSKDTYYRFMNSIHANWIRLTSLLASRIGTDVITPATSAERINALIVDDSVFSRGCSKKVELLAKVFDHANHAFLYCFRMLTLGWTDGNTFLPVNHVLLSSASHVLLSVVRKHSLKEHVYCHHFLQIHMVEAITSLSLHSHSVKSALPTFAPPDITKPCFLGAPKEPCR